MASVLRRMNTKLEVIEFVGLPIKGVGGSLTLCWPIYRKKKSRYMYELQNNNFRSERLTSLGASQALLSYSS